MFQVLTIFCFCTILKWRPWNWQFTSTPAKRTMPGFLVYELESRSRTFKNLRWREKRQWFLAILDGDCFTRMHYVAWLHCLFHASCSIWRVVVTWEIRFCNAKTWESSVLLHAILRDTSDRFWQWLTNYLSSFGALWPANGLRALFLRSLMPQPGNIVRHWMDMCILE